MNRILQLSILILSVTLINCTDLPIPPEEINLNLGKVFLKIDKENAPEAVVLVEAFLTRENHDTLYGVLNLLDSTSADILFEGVAAGDWFLKVDAKDNEGVVLYTGSTDITVHAGILTQVNLTLVPTGSGTGSIHIFVTWGTGSNDPWIKLNTTFQTDLHCIYVVNSQITYTGGAGGKIYKTINGGNSWSDISPQTNSHFSYMFFLDENLGWAGGKSGALVKTVDGGSTWEIMNIGSTIQSNTIMSIYFFNQNIGFLVGGNVVSDPFDRYGYIYKTTNGGNSWVQQSFVSGAIISESSFINENSGYVAGSNGLVFKTLNGGNSWADVSINTGYWLGAIYFLDQSNGFVMGQAGFGAKTTNGGNTWNSISLGTGVYIEEIAFRNASNGWAVGGSGSGSHTTNGGMQWNGFDFPTSNDLIGVHFNNGFGMISGRNGTILKYNTNN